MFELKCNSYWDLCKIFNCKREDLPKPLRRWLTNRWSSKPYTGNSILDVCDPVADVFDWVDDCLKFELTFYMSKTDINALCKKYNIELGIRDRSNDKDED